MGGLYLLWLGLLAIFIMRRIVHYICYNCYIDANMTNFQSIKRQAILPLPCQK